MKGQSSDGSSMSSNALTVLTVVQPNRRGGAKAC